MQWEQKRQRSLRSRPLFDLGKSYEAHHNIGEASDKNAITNLHEQRHDIITDCVNSEAVKFRKIPVIQRVQSIIGTLELLQKELLIARFKIRHNPTLDELRRALKERGIDLSTIESINKQSLEMMNYENVNQDLYEKEE